MRDPQRFRISPQVDRSQSRVGEGAAAALQRWAARSLRLRAAIPRACKSLCPLNKKPSCCPSHVWSLSSFSVMHVPRRVRDCHVMIGRGLAMWWSRHTVHVPRSQHPVGALLLRYLHAVWISHVDMPYVEQSLEVQGVQWPAMSTCIRRDPPRCPHTAECMHVDAITSCGPDETLR